MVTGLQIRVARGLLKWSAGELARRAGLGVATIARAEAVDGIPPIKATTLYAIQTALEEGVLFISVGQPSPGGGDGVRLRIRRPTR